MSKKYSEKKVVNNPYFRSHSKKFLFLVEPLHKFLSFFSAPHLFFIQLFIEKEKDILIAIFAHVSSSLVIAATIPILLINEE
jgi:hypothetical protein